MNKNIYVEHQLAGTDLVVGQGQLGQHVGLLPEASHLVHLGLVSSHYRYPRYE